jgi:hypothetical protein
MQTPFNARKILYIYWSFFVFSNYPGSLLIVEVFQGIHNTVCLDANKRRPDLDVNKGFSGAQGPLFKILKTLIFSSSNPLDTCIIYFCRKVNYSGLFPGEKKSQIDTINIL